MEKNWIEKIKEAVRIAMNKGLDIQGDSNNFSYTIAIRNKIYIYIFKDEINIGTSKGGYIHINYSITDRDDLELRALVLSIKEYNEDMAISELNEFISDKKEDSKLTINDLDNEDD